MSADPGASLGVGTCIDRSRLWAVSVWWFTAGFAAGASRDAVRPFSTGLPRESFISHVGSV